MTSGVNGCSSVKTSDAQVSASERRERTRFRRFLVQRLLRDSFNSRISVSV